MTDEKNQAVRADEQIERAEWKRPELHRIDTGEAEGAANAGNDNVIYS